MRLCQRCWDLVRELVELKQLTKAGRNVEVVRPEFCEHWAHRDLHRESFLYGMPSTTTLVSRKSKGTTLTRIYHLTEAEAREYERREDRR